MRAGAASVPSGNTSSPSFPEDLKDRVGSRLQSRCNKTHQESGRQHGGSERAYRRQDTQSQSYGSHPEQNTPEDILEDWSVKSFSRDHSTSKFSELREPAAYPNPGLPCYYQPIKPLSGSLSMEEIPRTPDTLTGDASLHPRSVTRSPSNVRTGDEVLCDLSWEARCPSFFKENLQSNQEEQEEAVSSRAVVFQGKSSKEAPHSGRNRTHLEQHRSLGGSRDNAFWLALEEQYKREVNSQHLHANGAFSSSVFQMDALSSQVASATAQQKRKRSHNISKIEPELEPQPKLKVFMDQFSIGGSGPPTFPNQKIMRLKIKAAEARCGSSGGAPDEVSYDWVIAPTSQFKIYFDVLVGALIVYSVLTVPVVLAFSMDEQRSVQDFDLAIDMIFFLDMALSFFTAYQMDDKYIYDLRLIRRNYLKSWFFVDLISTFPFDMLLMSLSHKASKFGVLKLVRVIRFFRLLKLVKLFRIFRLQSKISALNISSKIYVDPSFVSLATRLAEILFAAHLMCCIWHIISQCSNDSDNWKRCGKDNVGSSYLSAFYFTVTTMMTVGYGDIFPLTSSQRLFVIMIQISGPLSFGLIVSSINEVVDAFDSKSKHLADKMNAITEYMNEKNLPKALRKQVTRHFSYYYTHTTVYPEENITNQLPQMLHEKLLSEKHQKHLRVLRFFDPFLKKNMDFVYHLLPLLKPMLVQAGETIACQADPAEEVYFIYKGQVNGLRTNESNEHVLLGVYRQGSTLNLSNLVRYKDIHVTFRAAALSDLLWLHMEDLEGARYLCPDVEPLIKGLVAKEVNHLLEVLECETVTRDGHKTKELIYCNNDIQPSKDVIIEPIKGALMGKSTHSVRTVKFISGKKNTLAVAATFAKRSSVVKAISHSSNDVRYVEEEETTSSLARRLLINPKCESKLRWDAWIGVLTLYSIIFIPLGIGFQLPVEFDAIDLVVDAFFLTDVCFNFRTLLEAPGFQDVFLVDQKEIALRYAASWFPCDLVSSVPLDTISTYIQQTSRSSHNATGVTLVRILRLFRFFKLMRLFKMAKRAEALGIDFGAYNYYFTRLVQLIIWLLYIGHLFGCLWAFVAMQEPQGENWFPTLPDLKGVFDRYVASAYWAFTTITTVGYGDIVPVTDVERAFAAIIMILGGTIYSFIVGNVSKLLYHLDLLKKRERKRLMEIQDYSDEQKLGENLARSIKKHMQFVFSIQSAHNETEILKRLPLTLRRDALIFSHRYIIDRIPIFAGHTKDKAFISVVIQRMAPEFWQSGSFIYSTSDGSKGIYFLLTGIAQEVGPNPSASNESVLVIHSVVEQGHIFGYRKHLDSHCQKLGAQAVTDCSLYFLSSLEMATLENKYKAIGKKLRTVLIKCFIEQERALQSGDIDGHTNKNPGLAKETGLDKQLALGMNSSRLRLSQLAKMSTGLGFFQNQKEPSQNRNSTDVTL